MAAIRKLGKLEREHVGVEISPGRLTSHPRQGASRGIHPCIDSTESGSSWLGVWLQGSRLA